MNRKQVLLFLNPHAKNDKLIEIFTKVAEKNHAMMEYQKYVFIIVDEESDSAQSLQDYFGASFINCP